MLSLEYEFEIKYESTPCNIKNLKINDYILMDRKPCKVKSMKAYSTKKLDEKEILIKAEDIFTKELCSTRISSKSEVELPFIKYSVYLIISIDNNKLCTLMDITGNTRTDLKLPNTSKKEQEMSSQIIKSYNDKKEVLVTTCYSQSVDRIVSFKVLYNK